MHVQRNVWPYEQSQICLPQQDILRCRPLSYFLEEAFPLVVTYSARSPILR